MNASSANVADERPEHLRPQRSASVEVVPAIPQQLESGRDGHRAHVLVCVSGDGSDLELIRQGRVLADRLRGRLTVLCAFALGEDENQRRLLVTDRVYARALQAPLVELPAYSPADGIIEYSRARAVTHVVLGDAADVPWYASWRTGLPQQLAKRMEGIDLYLVSNASR